MNESIKEPLLGFRRWNADRVLLRLSAVVTGKDWFPGVNHATGCAQHESPGEDCHCGFNGWYDLDSNIDSYRGVTGSFAGCGTIYLHGEGFRSSEAQIIALLAENRLDAYRLKKLAKHYGVKVFTDRKKFIEYSKSKARSIHEIRDTLVEQDQEYDMVGKKSPFTNLFGRHTKTLRNLNRLQFFNYGIMASSFSILGLSLLLSPFGVDVDSATIPQIIIFAAILFTVATAIVYLVASKIHRNIFVCTMVASFTLMAVLSYQSPAETKEELQENFVTQTNSMTAVALSAQDNLLSGSPDITEASDLLDSADLSEVEVSEGENNSLLIEAEVADPSASKKTATQTAAIKVTKNRLTTFCENCETGFTTKDSEVQKDIISEYEINKETDAEASEELEFEQKETCTFGKPPLKVKKNTYIPNRVCE